MSSSRRLSGPLILFLYALISYLVIFGYYFFIPSPVRLLPILLWKWRFLNAFIGFIRIFPALMLSACILSSLSSDSPEDGPRFSPQFLGVMLKPMIMALVAALIYAVLFLLVQPLSIAERSDMETKSSLYAEASGYMDAAIGKQDWGLASRYMAICERAWPYSPELEQQRNILTVKLKELENAASRPQEQAKPLVKSATYELGPGPSLPGEVYPMNIDEALKLAAKAMSEGRWYDAHWLATVGEKLAKEGSPEVTQCRDIETKAMHEIEAQVPSAEKNSEGYLVYQQKRRGYRAVQAGDWISAYYIFKNLNDRGLKDEDVKKYLAMSVEGLKSLTFFSDEMGSVLGDVDNKALFSLPRKDGGRDILSARNAYLFADATYLQDMELIRLSPTGEREFSVTATMAKLVPFKGTELESDGSGPGLSEVRRSILLLVAVDRAREGVMVRPVWTGKPTAEADESRVPLDLTYEDIFLLSKARRNLDTLSIDELFQGDERLAPFGFVREVFQAELFSRIAEPFMFLAMSILALAFGWRLRPRRGFAWYFIPVVLVLPIFAGYALSFIRLFIRSLSTVLVLSVPFMTASLALLGALIVFLLASVVYLAGQRG